MPLGVYTCNRQFTQDQREMDQTYGIYQVQNRTLQFTQENSFKFTYHYYYEHQKLYTMVKQFSHDLIVSGTYIDEGNQVVATIVAGEYKKADQMSGLKEQVNNITGKLVFLANGDNIKVVSTQFSKPLARGGMIQADFVFKKKAQ